MPFFLFPIGHVNEINGMVIGVGIWNPFQQIRPIYAVANIG